MAGDFDGVEDDDAEDDDDELDDDESDFDESLEELDFSVAEPEPSLELELSELDDEVEPLPLELLDASRLSLR